nr:RNA-directed DNA polymerase, eukaryota, reverse transcriptase zinc-binding domain protein [Tanacetum cinerariifolium]
LLTPLLTPLLTMRFMGFNEKWMNWISGYLSSTTSSILINGSPTREFNISRGLRQGDPLSPILFIIAMEGLHVAIEDDIAAGLYRGLKVNTLILSHLFFADDTLFIGEWSRGRQDLSDNFILSSNETDRAKITHHHRVRNLWN